jgi:hypothetical protein
MNNARRVTSARTVSVLLAAFGVLAVIAAAAVAGPVHKWLGTTPKGVNFRFSSDGRRVTNLVFELRWYCENPDTSHSTGTIKVGFRSFALGRGAKVSMKQSFSTSEGSGQLSMSGALQDPRYKGYGKGRMGYTLTLSSGPHAGCATSRPSIAWAAKDLTLLKIKR